MQNNFDYQLVIYQKRSSNKRIIKSNESSNLLHRRILYIRNFKHQQIVI